MKKTLLITGIVLLVLVILLAIDAFTFGKSFAYLKHVFFPPAVDPQWEQHDPAPYVKRFPSGMSAEKKARIILNEMTLEEKIRYLGGYEFFGTQPVERLNIPPVWFADATSGVRRGLSTAFPVNVAMTASWNRDLIKNAGTAIAEECRAKGVSVILGPGMNIYRVPTCGRNFEYMGEDPYLAGSMGSAYIQGVQGRGVIACAKHLTANNSDYDRHRMSSDMDERTLREIYLPQFRMSVKNGNVKSIMAAYNPVNGIHASQHEHLIYDILFGEWDFDGFIMSDWTSVYSVKPVVKHGVDIEMPYGKYLNKENILPLIEKGEVSEADIDRKVMHLLTTFFQMGILERPVVSDRYGVNTDAHRKAALDIAREGIVLLKNGEGPDDSVLPLMGEQRIYLENVDSQAASRYGEVVRTPGEADIAIIRLGAPFEKRRGFLERMFHAGDLDFKPEELSHILEICRQAPTIVDIYLDRPAVVPEIAEACATLIGNFGASDEVVLDVVFGRFNPEGKLPFELPSSMDAVRAQKEDVPHDSENPLFPFGFGLRYG